ncbi:MAG: hypothetical protein AAGD01_11775 [Acidobacteriota bacterium]
MLRFVALLLLLWLLYRGFRLLAGKALRSAGEAAQKAAQKAAHNAARRAAQEAARRAGHQAGRGPAGFSGGGVGREPQKTTKAVGELVSCQRCGVYLPTGKALRASSGVYCSADCQQRGPRDGDSEPVSRAS